MPIADTWLIVILVFLAGCLGGLTNAIVAGEVRLPYKDPEARVFHPGWIGNVLVGGVAALVLWGLYGPMAEAVLVGVSVQGAAEPILRVSELFGGIVTGVGGGRILTDLVEKQRSKNEVAALTRTRDKLATAVSNLAGGQ